MSSPTWIFDGNKRRVYENPPDSSYIVVDGYRIYTPNNIVTAPQILYTDVKEDLWSRYCDYMYNTDWSTKVFFRSGGSYRFDDENGNPEFQSADFTLNANEGWRIVLANYPHETIFNGNLFSNLDKVMFDYSRLSCNGVVPRLNGYANLLTYNLNSSSGTCDLTEVISLLKKTKAIATASL